MSVLDVFQEETNAALHDFSREDQKYLPVEFGEGYEKAWNEARMFGQSVAGSNARNAVLQEYLQELREKTGVNLSEEFQPDAAGGGSYGFSDFSMLNDRLARLKEERPDLDIAPLSEDEISRRTLAKSRAAREEYYAMAQREKTWGGTFGSLFGSVAGAATDPINIAALPFAPAEGLGLLATSLRWGGIAALTQSAIETAGSQYREEVQPGYNASGQPLANIAEAFVGGAVIGGGAKALGNLWTRAKTGTWPRSVRDLGNIAESEANILDTNIYPGARGEVAHREALSKAVDDVAASRPVEVDDIITPDIHRSAALSEVNATKRVLDDWKAAQPHDDLDGIYAVAGARQADLARAGAEIERETGAAFINSGVKRRAEAEAKIGRKDYDSPRELTDIVRGGFSLSQPAQAEQVIAALGRRFEVIDEGWKTSPNGYIDRKVMVRLPDGVVAEVQMAPREMFSVKKGGGQRLYNEWRKLPVGDPRREPLARQQEDLYAAAVSALGDDWNAAFGSGGRSGNIASKSAPDTTAAELPTSASSTRFQEPRTTDQASPGFQSAGRPSQTQNFMRDSSKRNVMPLESDRKRLTEQALSEETAPKRVEEIPNDPDVEQAVLRNLDRLRVERGDLEIPVGEIVGEDGVRVAQTRKLDDILSEAEQREKAAKEIEDCAGPYPEDKK